MQAIHLPRDVLSTGDNFWNDVNEFLQDQGHIPEKNRLTAITISATAGEPVKITDLEHDRFEP